MASIDGLGAEIARALAQYTDEVEDKLEDAQKEVAKEAATKLRSAGGFKDQTGKYRKGWKSKKNGKGYVVFNATDGQLTHLLEKGHAKRNGGRTKAFPHIADVDEWVASEYEDRVRSALGD